MSQLPEVRDRGPVFWCLAWVGIRGGIVELKIHKNRMSFYKHFLFKNDEDFETAQRICKEKPQQIIHLKNTREPMLQRIAEYCIFATEVKEIVNEQK